jgi:predicted naringenin-chalcone synthase
MPVRLLGLGVATPQHQMTQQESLQMFTEIVCEEERQARLAGVLFRKAEVKTRHTILPHTVAYNWCGENSPTHPSARAFDRAIPSTTIPQVVPGQSKGPTTRERMELYARFASELAIESARQALEASGLAAQQITHLVVVTCTGFDAPGVDLELIERLGLPKTTQRVQVGFMGCHGAINGIRTALAIAGSNSQANVLLCAVELCSLHYRFTWDTEKIVGNALFADGSGSIVVSANQVDSLLPPSPLPTHGAWQIHDTGSVIINDSRETMSWSIGDHGFDMRLTSDVGDKIEAELAGWLTAWLQEHQLSLADITYWGVHPGGPRILTAVQSSLQLVDDALAVSRDILQRFGNMSSPTVLFILNEFQQMRSIKSHVEREHCVLLGFGPGLIAEIALLSVG